METAMLEALSAIADIGVLLPLLAAGTLMLAARREHDAALRWGAAFVVTVAVTGLLKSLLRGSADLPHFPSGHVAGAAAFYGGLLAILAGARRNSLGAFLALAVFAAAVGWSRTELTAHTWGDVAGGFGVAAAALLLFGCLGPPRPVAATARLWLAAGVALAAPAGYMAYPWLGHALRTLVE